MKMVLLLLTMLLMLTAFTACERQGETVPSSATTTPAATAPAATTAAMTTTMAMAPANDPVQTPMDPVAKLRAEQARLDARRNRIENFLQPSSATTKSKAAPAASQPSRPEGRP